MPRLPAVTVGLFVAAAGPAGCESLRPASAPAAAAAASVSPAPAAVPKRPGGVLPPVRVGPFVFYHDAPLPADDPVFRELETLPDQIQRELRLPVGATPVQVYLFPDQDGYEAFMADRFPWLPPRRAYFVTDPRRPGAATDLQVYTWMGDHLRTDLRHELTHGLLHGVLKGVPLWLDEGLAGFFEQPVAADGVNRDHLDKLRRAASPDLGRLEKITKVEQMEKPEYREAWAWVHYCLRGDPAARRALLDYLQALRETPTPGPLSPRLAARVADPGAGLTGHLARVAAGQ